jgi:hypothetical protein
MGPLKEVKEDLLAQIGRFRLISEDPPCNVQDGATVSMEKCCKCICAALTYISEELFI